MKQNEKVRKQKTQCKSQVSLQSAHDWIALLDYLKKKTNAHLFLPRLSLQCDGSEERDWCKEEKPSGAKSVWSLWKLFSLSAAPRCSLFGSAFFNEFITLWGVCLCQNVTFCLFCLGRAPQLGLHLLFWPFVSRGQTSKRNCCFARFLETFVPFGCEERFFFASFKRFVPIAKKKVDSRGILNEN